VWAQLARRALKPLPGEPRAAPARSVSAPNAYSKSTEGPGVRLGKALQVTATAKYGLLFERDG